MKATIVGLGLVGGSIALDMRRAGMVSEINGVDILARHVSEALELGLVDKVPSEDKALSEADLIILSIPVNSLGALLPSILDAVKPGAVVIDTGSTKAQICRAVANHPRREQFVAAHPIAGTENSGPRAAMTGLFAGKTNIICEKEKSSETALALAEKLFLTLGMRTVFMEPEDHDKHVAYV